MSSLFTLISLLLSLYLHGIIATPIKIANRDYSTDIVYALYNVETRWYLNSELHAVEEQPANGWIIGESAISNRYTLKNSETDKFLGADGRNYIGTYSYILDRAKDESLLAWEFAFFNTMHTPELPKVRILKDNSYRLEMRDTDIDQAVLCDIRTYPNNYNVVGWARDYRCQHYSEWVLIPISFPKTCQSITVNPAQPPELQSLQRQKDHQFTAKVVNEATEFVKWLSIESRTCRTMTTSFTKSKSSELSFGVTSTYSHSKGIKTSAGINGPFGASVGIEASLKASYGKSQSSQQTTNEENQNTQETKKESCTTIPSSENGCPPRTTCTRTVAVLKPPSDSYDITITAVCDGIEYTTKGKVSVAGIVMTEYGFSYEPLDCKYHVMDHGVFKPGTLQFCDTCNDDITCEICRDGYILLDGVCISPSVCAVKCGGETKGGKFFNVLGGDAPWSGGWCEINDEDKHQSIDCQQELGKLKEIQSMNGKCLEIETNDYKTNKDGGLIQTWKCDEGDNQQWHYDIDTKEIKNANGKCLDIDIDDYNSNINGGKVQILDCNQGMNQKWNYDTKTNQFRNEKGKCLDLERSHFDAKTNGGKLLISQCAGSKNQEWNLYKNKDLED